MNLLVSFWTSLTKALANFYSANLWLFIKSIPVTLITLSLMVLITSLENSWVNYNFQPYRVLNQSEWWRFFTAPLVHHGYDHLIYNLIVTAASSLVCERLNRRLYLLYLAIAWVVTLGAKFFIGSVFTNSGGFSNIASGSFVLLLGLFIVDGIRIRDGWFIAVAGAILAMFVAHELGVFGQQTGWQLVTGETIDGAPGKLVKPGHVIGIITGFMVVLVYGFITLAVRRR